jgi:DNA helicase II / ATP-dependent DNA helicase PcrA
MPVGLAEERFTKNLWSDRDVGEKPRLVSVRDEADQAQYVVERILENREQAISLKSQAVLFRASHHSAQLEIELIRRNIPFVKFGGLKFLEAAHIKDVLAVLRWAENVRDRISGFRVLQLLPGIGPAKAGRILEGISQQSDPMHALKAFSLPAATGEAWPAFIQAFGLVRHDPSWPSEMEAVCRWYQPHLERIYEDAVLRQADLLQLGQIASTYPTRERFLTELTLDPPDATSDEPGVPLLDEDYLILSTIHSAKGQEWKAVFILNAIDGCIPSDLSTGSTEEIEEERRLLYVAMTRAKDHLHLVLPQRFYAHQQRHNGDRHMYTVRTRFIPASILDHFESVAWPAPSAAISSLNLKAQPIDIRSRMRRMWS